MPSGAELTEAIPSDPQRRPVLTPSRSRRRHDHVSNDDIFLRAAGWTGGLATARVDRVRSSSKLDSPPRIALKANSSTPRRWAERRVGKEVGRSGRSRGSPYHQKKNIKI